MYYVGMAVSEDDRDEEIKGRVEEKRYDALKAAYESGRVQLLVDSHFHNTGKSPAYNASENLVPLLVLIMFSLTLMLFQGLVIGTVVLVLAMLIYVFGVRLWIADRVERRVAAAALQNLRSWRVYWKVGGIGLSLVGRSDLGVAAPQGDWKTFVQLHLGEPRVQAAGNVTRPGENALSPFSTELKAQKKAAPGESPVT